MSLATPGHPSASCQALLAVVQAVQRAHLDAEATNNHLCPALPSCLNRGSWWLGQHGASAIPLFWTADQRSRTAAETRTVAAQRLTNTSICNDKEAAGWGWHAAPSFGAILARSLPCLCRHSSGPMLQPMPIPQPHKGPHTGQKDLARSLPSSSTFAMPHHALAHALKTWGYADPS